MTSYFIVKIGNIGWGIVEWNTGDYMGKMIKRSRSFDKIESYFIDNFNNRPNYMRNLDGEICKNIHGALIPIR